MGFFDEIFGKSDVRQEVRRYFDGRSSDYEAFRRCMYDMIAVRSTTHDMNADNYMGKITDELLAQNGSPIMRDFIVVALQRIAVSPVKPQSVNFFRIYDKIVVWYDPEPMNQKPSGMLRYDLLINDNVGYAWVALYDDGTRMSKNIPGLEGSVWKVAVLSEKKISTPTKTETIVTQFVSASAENVSKIETLPTWRLAFKDIEELRKRGEKGDAEALWRLSNYYINGVPRCIVQNSRYAVELLKKSSELGFNRAFVDLGFCYRNGTGVPKDPEEAINCWFKAAMLPDTLDYVSSIISDCYENGYGVKKDMIEAYAWFNISAANYDSVTFREEIEKKRFTPSQIEAGLKRSREIVALIEAKKKAKSK
jgi:Sel1 repeat